MQGAAIIYFAYIGFDTAATTAQEARNPQRDVPAGIIGALVISTVLYVAMAAVMTGMVDYTKLDVAAPVAVALDEHPSLFWLGLPVKIGAIIGMTSVILMSILGQPRIFMAMARDGLLPPQLQKVHPKYHTPSVGTHHHRRDRGVLRRRVPDRRARRTGVDRHPARVHRGLRRRAGAAQDDAGGAAAVPRAARAGHLHGRRDRVPRAHVLPAAGHVDPARGLDRRSASRCTSATGTGTASRASSRS